LLILREFLRQSSPREGGGRGERKKGDGGRGRRVDELRIIVVKTRRSRRSDSMSRTNKDLLQDGCGLRERETSKETCENGKDYAVLITRGTQSPEWAAAKSTDASHPQILR